MRHSNHATRGRRRSDRAAGTGAPALALAVVMLFATIAAGCGPAAVASSSPTPVPTPAPTPDPHLKDPVTADQVYRVIASGGMRLYPNTATTSEGSIVKRIDADLDGWALRITAYTNGAAMLKARAWKAGGMPGRGEAPYNFSALNLLIAFGPTNPAAPAAPDTAHQATAAKLVEVLDPLLWPIEQHSVLAITARTAVPPTTPSTQPAKTQPAKSKAP